MYLYLAKILFYFELPKGGVAYIIMPYIALGLCCQGLRLLLIDAKWTGFYRVFAYLSIAPLVLLWVGIHTRITTYGLTEIRVMLVVLASMMTLFILFSMTQRLQQYRLFSLTACLLLFISTILTSPYYLAQQHQLARFERLLSELNILDEQQQISATIFDSQFAKQLSSEQVEKYKQLEEIIGGISRPIQRLSPNMVKKNSIIYMVFTTTRLFIIRHIKMKMSRSPFMLTILVDRITIPLISHLIRHYI